MNELVKQDVERWLEQVVIGLNLCPFAARPYRQGQVDIVVATALDEEQLLLQLHEQMARLIITPVQELETTLVAVPGMLFQFDHYNNFLDRAEALIDNAGWHDELQIASFHPDYQFVDTEPGDVSNLTNSAPVPIFHLIRQQSLTDVLMNYADQTKFPSAISPN